MNTKGTYFGPFCVPGFDYYIELLPYNLVVVSMNLAVLPGGTYWEAHGKLSLSESLLAHVDSNAFKTIHVADWERTVESDCQGVAALGDINILCVCACSRSGPTATLPLILSLIFLVQKYGTTSNAYLTILWSLLELV